MGRILKIQIPEALASELASKGLAEVQRTARSGAWELAWNAASAISVVVTLVQTPEVLKAFADDCLRLLKRDQSSSNRARGWTQKDPAVKSAYTSHLRPTLAKSRSFCKRYFFVDTKAEDEAQ